MWFNFIALLLLFPHPLLSWHTVFILWLLVLGILDSSWLIQCTVILNMYLPLFHPGQFCVFLIAPVAACCYGISLTFCISLPSDDLRSQAAGFWQNQHSFWRVTFSSYFFSPLATWQVRQVSGFHWLLRITTLNSRPQEQFLNRSYT